METKEGEPLLQRVERVRKVVGVAMDQDEANQALDLHPEIEHCRDLILELAGPYNIENRWLVRAEAARTDPTEEIVQSTDHLGRINGEMARRRASVSETQGNLEHAGDCRHEASKHRYAMGALQDPIEEMNTTKEDRE